MLTVHERTAAADRQIERMKLRVLEQLRHLEVVQRDGGDLETKRARALLDRTLGELSILQRYRLSLYQDAAFAHPLKRKAS